MAVMGLACFVFIGHRTKFLRYFIFLQALMLVCIVSNLVFEYLVTNVPDNRNFLLFWNIGNFIWSPFFLYYSLMHNLISSGHEPSRKLSVFFRLISALLFFPVLIPFLEGKGGQALVDSLTGLSVSVVLPACIFTSLFALVVKTLRYWLVRDAFTRSIMIKSIVVNSVMGPLLVFLFLSRPAGSGLFHTPLKLGIDMFFLVWNIMALNHFRFFLQPGAPSPTGAKPANEHEPEAEAGAGKAVAGQADFEAFDALKALIAREKPYLNPDLDLPLLAKMADMTRNRLSFLINACAGQSFSDYVNDLRVEEAKDYIESGECASILEVAFRSGFNSKATFYNAFKRATGRSPTTYRESGSSLLK
jgi:AraC-like DNA-binding protein